MRTVNTLKRMKTEPEPTRVTTPTATRDATPTYTEYGRELLLSTLGVVSMSCVPYCVALAVASC